MIHDEGCASRIRVRVFISTTVALMSCGAIQVDVAPSLKAQSLAGRMEFSAASIKPSKDSGNGGRSGGNGSLMFATAGIDSTPGGVTAKRIILDAYNLTEFQLYGGPHWLDADRFDFKARSETPADKSQLRQMLQTTLSQRFALRVHHETRDLPVYALMLGKDKPSLHPIGEGDADPPLAPLGSRNAKHHAIFRGSMQEFAHSIATDMGRPVVDRTGIAGLYFFFLQWDEDEGFGTAIREQLRLRFEAQKAPVDILVVDNIEKPSPN